MSHELVRRNVISAKKLDIRLSHVPNRRPAPNAPRKDTAIATAERY